MSKKASTEPSSDQTNLEGAMLRLQSLSLGNTECSSKSPALTPKMADQKQKLDPICCRTVLDSRCARATSRFKPYSVPRQLRRLSTPALSSRLRPMALKRRRSLSEERLKSIVLDLEEDSFSAGLPLFPLPPKDYAQELPSSSKPEAPTSCRQSCSREISCLSKPMTSEEMPATAEDDGEIEELTAYFDHFVSVRLKMSALAESMYA